MKIPAISKTRPYRQTARAEAAADTHRRIVGAFMEFARDRWLDDIALDEVARAADVTVQTVIRRFGGKDGLIQAVSELLGQEIPVRRAARGGGIEEALAGLVEDYEITGDLVVRILEQEARHPALRPVLDRGRAAHRAWVAETFAPWLADLALESRERRIAALVVVTDVYAWKLLRRDMGHDIGTVAAVMHELAAGLIARLPAGRFERL